MVGGEKAETGEISVIPSISPNVGMEQIGALGAIAGSNSDF
jgi:hypothetical protein